MFLSSMVLAFGLDHAVRNWRVAELIRQGEEGNRQAEATLAETRKLLQELAQQRAEIERMIREGDQRELAYLDFVRKAGPRLHPDHAEILYRGAEESRKKFGQPPFVRPKK